MFETGRIKNLLSTTLSKGNALVQEANLSNSNLKTLGNQFTNNSANTIAKFEGSFKGGVDQLSEFKNVATAEMKTLKNNIAPIADKTIKAVTGDINNIQRIVGVPETNKILNANNQVVNNAIDNIGNGSSGSSDGSDALIANQLPERNEGEEKIEGQESGTVTVSGTIPRANPLERFVSANYQITLSALTNEELADPDNTYMKNGPQHIIIKSGGGTQGIGGKKVDTSMETDIGNNNLAAWNIGRTEYFIEDLTIDSIISPNPKSRTTAYHQMTFKVIEPYSMGQFLEALEIGARRAGHVNYLGAPFMLSIDWVGWLQEPSKPGGVDFNDTVGDIKRLSDMAGESGRHLPIMITRSTFNVTTRGTEYDCTAIAYNGGALTDGVQQIKTDIAISGETVEQILQSGAGSLATVINSSLLKREAKDERIFADEYVVLFPVKEASASSPVAGQKLNSAVSVKNLTKEEAIKHFNSSKISESQLRQVIGETKEFDFQIWAKKILGVSIKRNNISEELKADQVIQANINSIGKSKIVFDPLQDGSTSPTNEELAHSKTKNITEQQVNQIPKNTREIKFKKGTKINKIIEEVVLSSEYGRGLLDRATKESGAKEWFRIETQVFNIPVKEAEEQRGKPPKIYVFRVVPYDVNVSVTEKPSEIMHGEDDIRNHVVKYYDYMYTGQNKDIINLEINFENRFLTPVSPDKGAKQKDVIDHGSHATNRSHDENSNSQKPKEGSSDNIKGGIRKVGQVSIGNPSSSVRGIPGNEKEDIARTFHNALVNHTVDLMQLKLRIWGDPYYISDSGVGNYNSSGAGKGGKAMIDPRGQMVYKSKQVYINITFRTPIDVGYNGVMEFNQAQDNDTKASHQLEKFSGIYWVTNVNSSFSGGKFEQELTLLRQRNQSGQAVETKKAEKNKSSGSYLEDFNGRNRISGPPHYAHASAYTRGKNNSSLDGTGAGSIFS